ncbi:MAG: phosphate ABC transporter substrate-binding protein PstS [Armatimonadota bacterium]
MKTSITKTGIISLLACAVMVLIAISQALAAGPNLNGAGATFPYPLYSKWFSVYGQNAGVQINYQSIGSGGGIKQLQAGTVDFGASDAPLSDADLKKMPAPVVHIPTVAGAVVLVYNLPGIGKGLKLSPQVIAGIYLGQITKWNDKNIKALNPKVNLPGLTIAVAYRSDGSGTSYIYTSYLSAVSSAWKSKVGAGKSVNWPVGIGGKGNEGVSGIVQQTPGSIGYVELAYAVQNKLSYASIRNKSGNFIEPGIASTTAAAAGAVSAMKKDVRVSIVNSAGKTAYPIAGFTYILIYKHPKDAARGKAVVTFLRWANYDGQKYAAPLLYAPLPKEVMHLNEVALKSVK